MMRRFLVLCSGLLAFAAHAGAENSIDQISWYHPDYPPSFILNGPYEGKGIIDRFIQGVTDRTPNHLHRVVTANMKRIEHQLQHEDLACAASLFKTAAREEFTVFSIPYMFVFPVGMIYRTQDAEKFEPLVRDDGTVSLEQLLKQQSLILGYSHGRSYHKEVDRLIAAQANTENSEMVSKLSISEGVLDLLYRQRVDYAVGFAFEGEWFERNNNADGAFSFYPFTEAQAVQYNYMGCSKTPQGEKAIEAINAALKELRLDPDFYGVYLGWISPLERTRYMDLLEGGFPQ